MEVIGCVVPCPEPRVLLKRSEKYWFVAWFVEHRIRIYASMGELGCFDICG